MRFVLGVVTLVSTFLSMFTTAQCEIIPPEPFPIFAWWSVPVNATSVERYRELREIGFTYSFTEFPNNDEVLKALNAAEKAGVKLYIGCPELRKKPEETAKKFMNHPALGGYMLDDEPSAEEFQSLAELVKKVQSVDKSHPCYINLFPTYASPKQLGTATYQEHVDQFIEKVPVPFISFDHYPIHEDGSMEPEWYENMEIISKAAKKAGKPFWTVVLSDAIKGAYPIATPTHLRLQVYSDLAYGAQAIQYFTYWTPDSWEHYSAPLTVDLKRTVVYERVWEMNKDIMALSGVFNNSKVLSVSHTGEPIPKGTRHIHKFAPPISDLTITGAGAIVSELEKGSRRFLVIVNRELENIAQVSITVDDAEKVKRVRKNGSYYPLIFQQTLHHIEPGDIAIFMWEK